MRKVFLVFLVFLNCSFATLTNLPNEYYELSDTNAIKSEFINHFLPIINKENEKILKEREFVESFFDNNFLINLKQKMTRENLLTLTKIANKYRIQKLFDKQEYLKRVDVIPPSLALAQAVLESGWGKSRFAKKANNFFGHWNFNGVGLDSLDESVGNHQKIKTFKSINHAVSEYMLNLNRHFAYTEFRDKRNLNRVLGQDFDGIEASKTLTNYSELGKKYVSKLQHLINSHEFTIFDKKEQIQTNYALLF